MQYEFVAVIASVVTIITTTIICTSTTNVFKIVADYCAIFSPRINPYLKVALNGNSGATWLELNVMC